MLLPTKAVVNLPLGAGQERQLPVITSLLNTDTAVVKGGPTRDQEVHPGLPLSPKVRRRKPRSTLGLPNVIREKAEKKHKETGLSSSHCHKGETLSQEVAPVLSLS